MKKYERIVSNLTEYLRTRSNCVGNAKVAACLYYKNKYFYADNKAKTDPFSLTHFSKHPIYIHAEVGVIKQALKMLSDRELERATLVVVRVLKTGELAMAKPCKKGCEQLIKSLGINKIVYTTEQGLEMLTYK